MDSGDLMESVIRRKTPSAPDARPLPAKPAISTDPSYGTAGRTIRGFITMPVRAGVSAAQHYRWAKAIKEALERRMLP
jgi:hypothetical protein